MTTWRRLLMAAAVLMAVVLTQANAQGQPLDLGTLGGAHSGALGINASGQIVGAASLAGDHETHAFSWTAEGGMVDLGTLGGMTSVATAVNPLGLVVGYSSLEGETDEHGFACTTDGMVDLGTLGGTWSTVTAVNVTGEVIVGDSTLVDDETVHAFAWTWAGGMVDLGTLGGTFSQATGVDSEGRVVGRSTTEYGYMEAFCWTPEGGMIDLGEADTRAVSVATNAGGDVVIVRDSEHAVLWRWDTGFQDVPLTGGLGDGRISDTGMVILGNLTPDPSGFLCGGFEGWSVDAGDLGGFRDCGPDRVFAVAVADQWVAARDRPVESLFSWTSDTGARRLPSLSGDRISCGVSGINPYGDIVGSCGGRLPAHAVVWWAPTP